MMKRNFRLMFERSAQAVLLLEKSLIVYANPRAQTLLGFDPQGNTLTDLTDYGFVHKCMTHQDHTVAHYQSIRFGNQYFNVSRTGFENATLLFLHCKIDPTFTEAFLHDTLLALLAQIRTLPESRQKREMETLANSAAAVARPVCVLTDLRDFLSHTFSHFGFLTDTNRIEFDFDEARASVLVYAELLYLTLVWVVLDLIRIIGADGRLKISYRRESDTAALSFSAEHAVLPQELKALLTATTASDLHEILNRNGSALFRAKRVFVLHGAIPEFCEVDDGFTVTIHLPVAETPAQLYAPCCELARSWGIDYETMDLYIRDQLEKA